MKRTLWRSKGNVGRDKTSIHDDRQENRVGTDVLAIQVSVMLM